MSKPDGLLGTPHGIAFSQEGGAASVNLLGADGQITALFDGINVQGMWDDGQYLYSVEDRKGDGRLMRYEWATRRVEVLRDKLSEAESVTRCPDGHMYYTEKEKGVVRELTADGQDPVHLAGLNQPSFVLCDAHGLWITEDSTHRARLLLAEGNAAPRTVLSFLKAPQAILPLGEDRYLLAEGGRDRVLELHPAR
ncbi:MAG: Serine/threonine-protein kinase PknD [Stenotrophomonas maltophilia]|nr:MAG: Serine/threonine-protein kinase PknD [Stenotrophomonas maltophilia]